MCYLDGRSVLLKSGQFRRTKTAVDTKRRLWKQCEVRFRFGLADSPLGSVWVGANGSRVSRPEEYWDIMTSENVMFLLPTPSAPKLRFVPSPGTFVFIEPLKPRSKRTYRGVVAEPKVPHSTRSPEKLPVDRLAFLAHAHHSTLAWPGAVPPF